MSKEFDETWKIKAVIEKALEDMPCLDAEDVGCFDGEFSCDDTLLGEVPMGYDAYTVANGIEGKRTYLISILRVKD